MELVIGRGLDNILFGMRETDVVAVLGSPDKGYEEDGERRLCFNQLRCSFWFSDDRLHWIRCANSKLTLFGKHLYNRPSEEAIVFLSSKLKESPELEDYGEWESHIFPQHWLELQFDYDTLSKVCFGHLFGEDDEPVWPISD